MCVGLFHGRGRSRASGAFSRVCAAATVFLLAAAMLAFFAPAAHADGGDYKLDFVAAAPESYVHSTGGGAFDDRTIVGNDTDDVVESLEGGDFECLDLVTYLTQIRRAPGTGDAETLVLQYSFLADTTGQSGVALTEVVNVEVNYGNVESGDGADGEDIGIRDDGGSTATYVQTDNGIPAFTKGAEIYATVTVTDVEPGEWIVIRIDVLLECDEGGPTGNLQAQLNYTDVTVSSTADTPDRVPGGEQTIPFKTIKDVYPVSCPEQDYIYDGQHPSCNEGLSPDPNADTAATASVQQTSLPLVGPVVDEVVENPQIGAMSMTGALLALVALRRRRSGRNPQI